MLMVERFEPMPCWRARRSHPAGSPHPESMGNIQVMAMPPPFPQPDREVLAGIVERVTFHNAETGFCVPRVKARGHLDLATIVGHAATISPGDCVNDRTHGQQFKARFLRASAAVLPG